MHPSVHAARTPDKPAIVMAESGEIVTYAALEARANQIAHLFRAAGLGHGDVIAFMMENHPLLHPVAWGAQRAGLYYTSISTKLLHEEARHIVEDSGARILVFTPGMADLARTLRAALPHVRFLIAGAADDRFERLEEVCAPLPQTPIADQRAGQDMLYSSGTTGRPKGIKPALPADATLLQHTNNSRLAAELYGMGGDTVYLSPAPLYHAAPLRWTMAVHKLGGTAIVMERFDAERALALIAAHRVTHAQFVPTHFVRMLRLPAETRAKYDVSSLRVAIHAAAPCPVHVKQAMMEWWGPILHEFYGGTEGNGICAIGPHDWLTHKGSVGRAVIGEVKICDDAGEPLPAGCEGLVYFAGGRVFEYHNDPEKTAQSRNAYGWSTIGDIGYLDEEGFLYLTDRRSFVIISGGVNIYPQEIENVLIEHPDIVDVAVFGAPDEEMGERVVAMVEPAAHVSADAAFADALIAHARARLSAVKIPRRIVFRTPLPRDPTGKLIKRKLAALLDGAPAHEG